MTVVLLTAAVPAAADGDPERGGRAFAKCYACHSVNPEETGLPGPNLHGIVGRPAADREGFRYSPAMVQAAGDGLVWTEAMLADFIRDPESVVPGTAMNFLGIPRTRERLDIVAYLQAMAAAEVE